MVELALRDGWPPSVLLTLPRGEAGFTCLSDGRIRVDHADPRILISGELLDEITANPTDYVRVDDGVLTIRAIDRTLVYRITQYIPAVHGYIGEWPD